MRGMRAIRTMLQAAVTLSVVASTAAWSRSLDAQALKDFGGTYMVDCSNSASARATVFANALVFLDGDRRIASNSIETGFSFFHPSPSPKGFLVSLINTGPGNAEMLWHVFRDGTGQYLVYEQGDAKSEAILRKAVANRKLRRCDGGVATRASPGATSAPTPTPPLAASRRSDALHELSASGILMDRKASAAYYRALGPLRRELWLATLDGPSPQNRWVNVGGTQYLLASACKNHDCANNNTVLLYSAAQNVLVGAVYRGGKTTLIGAPSPATAKELGHLWREEFRRKP